MATRGKPQTKEAKLLDILYGKPAAGDLRNTPMLKQTGEGSYLRQQYPEGYGFGAGLLGTLPDDISGSVLDPNTARVKQGAVYGLPTGVALEATPFAGPALKGAKMTGKALGAGLNEAIYHGAQSPLSQFIPEAVKPLYAVKNKGGGGNVFNVENALKQLKPNAGIDPQDAYELGISNRGDIAIGNWIDTKLTKYIKNELGTENDPVRLLAEKGKLHFDPDVASGRRTRAQQNRRTAGFPEQGASESQLAVDWEALADSQMQPWTSGGPDIPAGAQAYKFGTSFQTSKVLGFDHIIDELRNATTLGDALPKVLQIDPKKLEQMSVSDVVNHVSKINEWRANQAARSHDAAIKVLEKSPVTSVVKEYPDGYKWVELKLPDTVQDITPLIRKDGDVFEIYEPGQTLSWKDPSTGRVGWKSPEDATAAYSKSKNYRELEKALELEGSSMGHCVGGYCPAVAEGKVRIFSLRDPKGRAHATIEVEPPVSPREGTIGQEELPPEVFADLKRRNVLDDNIRWKFDDTTGRYMPQLGPFEPTIHQIKGKGNARPIEKYDPYTQDFIQGNDWHIVEEAANAGLRDISYELGSTLKYAEEGLGLKLPRFVPDSDYRQLISHMDETLDTGIPREVPEALTKYLPVEATPALPPLPAPTPEPVTNPFWYNPKSKQLEAFDVENTHTKSLMDPDYATKLGVAPLDPSSLNMEHGSLLMGRTDRVAPNTLSLMQVDEFTPESLSSIQAMLNEKNLPHEKFSLSGGSSLYENVPAESIRGAKTLEDLKQFRIGGEEPPAYAAGGSVTTPDLEDEKAAFGVYPNAGKRSQKSDIGDKLNASLVPQDALDLALTVLPFGKVGKTLAAAIVSGAPAEAQAGNMSSLLKLVAKEAPEQFHSIREALVRAFKTDLEHSVVGSTRMGGPSEVVGGKTSSVVPSKTDIANARRNIDQSALIDFHTHPSHNLTRFKSEFRVRPSDTDLQFWMNNYGNARTATTPNEIKTMVGSPPLRQEGITSAYNFFATNKPNQTLDRRAYDAARYELQRSKSLQSLKDNPDVRQYLDTGGTLGDLFESSSPMVLQKLYAQKGLGRHDMRLSNAPVAGPLGTESNLFNEIVNPAIEVLKAKRFAEGGSVSTLAKFKR